MPALPNISKADLEKIILIGIGAFIAAFLIIQFGIVPSLRTIGQLNKDIVSEKAALKDAQMLIANKAQLNQRLSAMKGKIAEFEKALPPSGEMPNILQKITDIAYKSKVKLIKLEPLRPTEKPVETLKAGAVKPGAKADTSKKPKTLYIENPIQVEAKGGYHAIGDFINKIETSDNIMSISDIDISASPDDIQNHSAKFLIIAYVLREEAPAK